MRLEWLKEKQKIWFQAFVWYCHGKLFFFPSSFRYFDLWLSREMSFNQFWVDLCCLPFVRLYRIRATIHTSRFSHFHSRSKPFWAVSKHRIHTGPWFMSQEGEINEKKRNGNLKLRWLSCSKQKQHQHGHGDGGGWNVNIFAQKGSSSCCCLLASGCWWTNSINLM